MEFNRIQMVPHGAQVVLHGGECISQNCSTEALRRNYSVELCSVIQKPCRLVLCTPCLYSLNPMHGYAQVNTSYIHIYCNVYISYKTSKNVRNFAWIHGVGHEEVISGIEITTSFRKSCCYRGHKTSTSMMKQFYMRVFRICTLGGCKTTPKT